MAYLPTWMVDFYGFHVGKYTIVPWIRHGLHNFVNYITRMYDCMRNSLNTPGIVDSDMSPQYAWNCDRFLETRNMYKHKRSFFRRKSIRLYINIYIYIYNRSRKTNSTSFDLTRFTISSLLLLIQDAEVPQSLFVVLMSSPQSDHRQWAEAA